MSLGHHIAPMAQKDVINDIVQMNLRTLELKARIKPRGQHPKHHGGLIGQFTIKEDPGGIYSRYRIGIFANPGKIYSCFARFSNGARKDDRKPDAHGMAIKIFEKGGALSAMTNGNDSDQDFVLVNHPVFFLNNMEENYAFNKGFTQLLDFKRNWAASFLGFFKRLFRVFNSLYLFVLPYRELLKRARAFSGQTITSPLHSKYWSTTPFRLGDSDVVKYVISPHSVFNIEMTDRDGLKSNLGSHITRREAGFSFGLITKADLNSSDIDQLTDNWSDGDHIYVPLADINFPVHTDAELQTYSNLAESATFSPSQTLHEHAPLGLVNLTRGEVYAAMSSARKTGT